MVKKTKSIFTRTLAASLIPCFVSFAAIMFIASHMIYRYSDSRVRETVSFFAVYASEKITDTLAHISSLVKLTSDSMADIAADTTASRANLQNMLFALMEANPEIYCAWYVFDSGVVSQDPGWFIETYLKRDGDIILAPSETQEQLEDSKYSPWHTEPFRTGKPYQDAVEYWDYGIGDGVEFTGTIAYPIYRDGTIIGTLGIDILYENAFKFMDEWQIPGERKILLLASNGIVLYSQNDEFKRRDYHGMGFAAEDAAAFDASMKSGEQLIKEIDSPLFGQRSLVNVSPVSIPNAVHNIFLYLDQPTDILNRPVRGVVEGVVLMGLAGLLVTGLASFFATRSISRPIGFITRFASRVANGDRLAGQEELARVPASGDEVEQLRNSLAEMLSQLNQNHELKLFAMEAEFEKKKVEEASRERTQFFANMSHEIRTPMNAIMGISELMLSEPLPPAQLDRARDIKSSAESLLVIINDILDISRIESGRFNLVEADFDFQVFLHNVSSVCQYLAAEKNLEFRMESKGDLPRYLRGDEGRLKQILLNLLSNAIKFTEKGNVRLAVDADSGNLHFDVLDTGIGIRDVDKGHLFNAFKQVDQLKNRRIKGTGLGLSISRSLVEMMGGTISVDSAYGRGSVFHVVLPLVPGDAAKVEQAMAGGDGMVMSDARVLVVDDNPVNLKVAKGLMGLHGLRCDVAESGAEAIAMERETEYALVFMDHMMPGMDGVETTRHIRALGGRHETTIIIALTANAIAGVKDTLLAAGMNDYISKPIERDKLNVILRRWLSAGRELDAPVQPPPSADPFIQAGAIPELNVAEALKQVANQQELYLDVLRTGRDALPQLLDAIRDALSRDDAQRLRIEVHSLKSMTRSMGAFSLSASAQALETAIATGPDTLWRPLVPPLMDNAAILLDSLEKINFPGAEKT